MNIVMYFNHRLFPTPYQRVYVHRCGCGRTIFKANTENIMIANDIGLPWESYPASSAVIEIQCHSCKSKYKILFQ